VCYMIVVAIFFSSGNVKTALFTPTVLVELYHNIPDPQSVERVTKVVYDAVQQRLITGKGIQQKVL